MDVAPALRNHRSIYDQETPDWTNSKGCKSLCQSHPIQKSWMQKGLLLLTFVLFYAVHLQQVGTADAADYTARISVQDVPWLDADSGKVPPSLEHIFVCITFYWDVNDLVFLRQVLINVSRYPTQVDISIISNEPERLKLAMQSWENTGVSIHRPRGNLTKPFDLAHEHRAYMEEAFNTTSYTAFMYIEHDMRVPWEALLGWAADALFLDSLNFQRAFYRVEMMENSGQLGLVDQTRPINPDYPHCMNAQVFAGGRLQKVRAFLMMPNPYMGMWIATQQTLSRLVKSTLWTQRVMPWDVREMAACGLQFADVPEGFWSAAVVPFDPVSLQLDPNSAIEHLSNKYCGYNTRDGTVRGANATDAELLCTVQPERFLTA